MLNAVHSWYGFQMVRYRFAKDKPRMFWQEKSKAGIITPALPILVGGFLISE